MRFTSILANRGRGYNLDRAKGISADRGYSSCRDFFGEISMRRYTIISTKKCIEIFFFTCYWNLIEI